MMRQRRLLKKMSSKNEILNCKKANIELLAEDEIFVQVHNTYNYWVSNYGRVVNNLGEKTVMCMDCNMVFIKQEKQEKEKGQEAV